MNTGSVGAGSHAAHAANHPAPPSAHSSEVVVEAFGERAASDHFSRASSSARSAAAESKGRLERAIERGTANTSEPLPHEEVERFLNESSQFAATAKATGPDAAANAASDLRAMNQSLNKTIDIAQNHLTDNIAKVEAKPISEAALHEHATLLHKSNGLRSMKARFNSVHGSLADLLDAKVSLKSKRSVLKAPWMVALLTGSATVVTLAVLSALFAPRRKSSKLLVIRDQLPQPIPPIQIMPQPQLQAPIAAPPPLHGHNQPIIVVLPNGLNGLPKNSQN